MDDDLICLRPVKIAEGLIALVEEVTDESRGALIQVLEVGGELGIDVSTREEEVIRCRSKVRHWLKKRSILPETGTKRWRSTGGALAGTLIAGHLLEGRRKGWGFWRS